MISRPLESFALQEFARSARPSVSPDLERTEFFRTLRSFAPLSDERREAFSNDFAHSRAPSVQKGPEIDYDVSGRSDRRPVGNPTVC